MCGLVGIIHTHATTDELVKRVEKMKNVLLHRGPDGEGTFTDPTGKPVVLGHRRLAIIDPEHGKQPMTTEDGMLTITFNGAIYNYLELRRELIARGHPIRTFSDTEVLLYAYREWGKLCVEKLHGMFAFAIWDQRNQTLFCARDRIGIKPFYYYVDKNCFVFASEIKAMIASDYVKSEVNYPGLQDYVTFQFCLNEKTLFQHILKLEPGQSLEVRLHHNEIKVDIHTYWDLAYKVDTQHDEAYFVDRLASLLEESVHEHLRSDVPIGAHLSGGLDSSTVVCLATSMLKGMNFNTFTGGFREGVQFDETRHAKLVSELTGSIYHEVYIPSDEFSSILPKLIHYMDEPLAGPGLIPQYYVSKLAAETVKVVLGGQGGDELYIGYARYLVAYLEKCLQQSINPQPNLADGNITLGDITPNLSVLNGYQPMLQQFFGEGMFESDDRRYFRLVDRSEGMRDLFSPEIFKGYSAFESYQKIFNHKDSESLINRMTYFDLKASLPALLHVEDRTSMSVSLESRVPLLDHRLVEFMATVPPAIKFASGRAKHLFKETVKNIVPKPILERKDKMGFPVPLNAWFQGSAKNFVMDTLLSQRARERGIYNVSAVEKSLNQKNSFSRVVWGLLCLELWHQVHIDGAAI